MSDDDYFTQSLETAMMKVATLGMQKEAMRENIANLQTSFSLQLDITKAMLEEKEAMLKHITDLEEALKRVVSICSLYSHDGRGDIALMATAIEQQFAYLFDLDDGYEPPEHMTADDFNEMHSGPFQPDDEVVA